MLSYFLNLTILFIFSAEKIEKIFTDEIIMPINFIFIFKSFMLSLNCLPAALIMCAKYTSMK